MNYDYSLQPWQVVVDQYNLWPTMSADLPGMQINAWPSRRCSQCFDSDPSDTCEIGQGKGDGEHDHVTATSHMVGFVSFKPSQCF